MPQTNNYPKLHNAAWPGVVGKGSGDGEPIIPLDTMLELTASIGSAETLLLEANLPGKRSPNTYGSKMQLAHRGGRLTTT